MKFLLKPLVSDLVMRLYPRKFFLGGLAFSLLLLLGGFFLFRLLISLEELEEFYPSYHHARRDGATYDPLGWLPQNTPKTAYQIYERHNLDTNSQMVYLRYDPHELVDLSGYRKISASALPGSASWAVPWWWHLFASWRFQFYRHQNDMGRPAYLALDPAKGYFYYWYFYPSPTGL